MAIKAFEYFAEFLIDDKLATKAMETMAKKGEELGKGFDGMAGKFAKVGIAMGAAFAGAAAAIVAGSVKIANENANAMKKIQLQTGATDTEMKKLDTTMKNIYKNNVGQSFDDIADAMIVVKQNANISGEALEKTTKSALQMRDVFNLDVKEGLKSAKAMADNFNISLDQAQNLMKQGFQSGLDYAGDFGDTINEYSVQFKSLGFSAEDFMNVLKKGKDEGAFNLDKVADSVKEFNIRVKDGSDTTKQAFQTIGMDAQTMASKFAVGGDTAQTAFKQVVQAIGSIKDPVKQNTVGVQLFGTQWEDMGAKAILSLGNIKSEFDKSKNVLDSLNGIKYNNFSSAMEGIKRQIQVGVLLPLGEKLLPKLNEFANWLQSNSGKIVNVAENIFNGIGKTIEGAFNVLQMFGAALKGVLGIDIGGWFNDLAKSSQKYTEEGQKRIDGINNEIKALDDKKQKALDGVKAEVDASFDALLKKEGIDKQKLESDLTYTQNHEKELQNQLDNLDKYYQDQQDKATKASEARIEVIDKEKEAEQEHHDQVLEDLDNQAESAKESSDLQIKAIDDLIEKEQERHDGVIQNINDEYDEKLKLIDEELYNKKKALEDQVDVLNEQTEQEREAKKKKDEEEKLAELEKATNEASTQEERQKAVKAYNEYVAQLQQEQREAQRAAMIETINDKITELETQAKMEKEKLTNQKENLIKQENDKNELTKQSLANEKTAIQTSLELKLKELEQKKKMENDLFNDKMKVLEKEKEMEQKSLQNTIENLKKQQEATRASLKQKLEDATKVETAIRAELTKTTQMYNDEIAKRQSMIEASYKQEVATKQKILEQAQQEETQKKQAQDDQERLQSLTDFSNTGFFKFFETVGKGIGDAGKWVTDKLGIDTSGIKQSAQAYEPTYERMIRGHADGTEYTTKGDILWNEKRPEVLSVESGLKVRQMDDYFNYDKVEQIVKENSSQPIQIIIQGATIREEQDIQKLSKSVAEELYKLQIKNDRAYKGV